MEDIISHGRPPHGGWRRRVVPAVVVVAIAALAVAEHVGHGGAARPGKSAAAGKARSVRRHPPTGPAVIVGQSQPWAATARMPRTGIQPAWFALANGHVQPIGGLPRYGSGYVFTKIQGGWLLQPKLVATATCGDCSGPTSSAMAGCGSCPRPAAAVYYLATNARAVTTIGVATMVAPAAARGLAWLTWFPTNSGLGTTVGIAREYDSKGRAHGPAVSLPIGYKIVRGTRKGLLLTAVTGGPHPGPDRLWNPARPNAIRTFRRVIAASASQLALVSHCAARCSLRVLNLVTGQHTTLRLAHGDPVTGKFSPDGRYLALEVRQARAVYLDVVTLASDHVIAVPRTAVSGSAFGSFGWPGNGDYLAAKLTVGARVRITYWNAANAATAFASIRATLDPNELITG
ncbi:MAG TPA: hypothetical protein VFI65_12605 [Streptosporangiaceae bacterium]|nr:hypothetical protein [Streptosporangiaceae bacterium]